MDISTLRILEVGDAPLFKRAFPANTLAIWTGGNQADESSPGWRNFTLGRWSEIRRAVRSGPFDLIVCQPPLYAPWDPRSLARALFGRRTLAGHSPLIRGLGTTLVRGRLAAPLVVLDRDDLPVINRHGIRLLDRCRAYFKRELPTDRWRVFMKTAHANLPTPRFRASPRFAARIGRLHPISLGLRHDRVAHLVRDERPKSSDVFFAGISDANSTVRARGIAQLRRLADAGLRIDIPDRMLPLPEFFERCARAWLCWSPEGLGWDCFRHYEAAACGSVPLISQPAIERHRPLLDGVHALYYDIEGDGLERAVRAALADTDRLRTIATAGRAHVLTHHTEASLCRYVAETALAAGPAQAS
ncbi:MAG: glycosyltransferase family 1 protein [Alphaproteobacteria bacterium]|nr:glycosyltransferase family 1 protein [Alphaproteobacteria bacterium]